MRKILLASLIGLSVVTMAGCATQKPPSQAEISTANYGELPKNYKEQITNSLSSRLKDPYTAQFTFLPPFKGYSQDGPWSPSGGKSYFGWVAPVLVNAKNSYGGYTGNQKYVFMFSGGVLYDVTGNDAFNRVKPVN